MKNFIYLFIPLVFSLWTNWGFSQDCESTIYIISTEDDGEGSLRQAIAQACAGAIITLEPTLAQSEVILSSGELIIDKPLTIRGLGRLRIRANYESRIFNIAANLNDTIQIDGVTIEEGSANDAPISPYQGGAIYNHATLILSNCEVRNNHIISSRLIEGGGIYNAGRLLVQHSSIVENEVNATVSNAYGGGIYNIGEVYMTYSKLMGNKAKGYSAGGGIYNDQGKLHIIASSIIDNFAGAAPVHTSGSGGGVYNDKGDVVIYASSFYKNLSESNGGAIENNGGDITLTNTTISTNEAYYGGGIYNNAAGNIAISHSTIVHNLAEQKERGTPNGGGIHNNGSIQISNSIVALNTKDPALENETPNDVFGNITTVGHNIIGVNDFGLIPHASDLAGSITEPLDPLLGAAAYNKSHTHSHEPLAGSPAIDAGGEVNAEVIEDQRMFVRNQLSDIGAIESQAIPPGCQVISSLDHTPGSLRHTIDQAPANCTITFHPLLSGSTLELDSTHITIDKPLHIQGPGKELLTVSGAYKVRVFYVDVASSDTVTLEGLQIAHGSLQYADRIDFKGVGIYNKGNLKINDCSIFDNRRSEPVSTSGGGIYNSGYVRIASSIITKNEADGAFNAASGGGISNSGQAEIYESIISENIAVARDGEGGGIYNLGNLIIQNSQIANNIINTRTAFGSGLSNNGSVYIINTTFHHNEAYGSLMEGGAIYNRYGEIELHASTLRHHNQGAIYNSRGFIDIFNSTISNNRFEDGGGIYNVGDDESGKITLHHSTISENIARSRGGGIANFQGEIILNSTILSNNQTWNYETDMPSEFNYSDGFGEFQSVGYNIVGQSEGMIISPEIGDYIGNAITPINPLLGKLEDNGGLTYTHALLEGSPAIDGGNPNSNFNRDQRGNFRPVGGRADIGAFEAGVACVVTSAKDDGLGSLRQAVAFANCDTIRFAEDLAGKEIILNSEIVIDRDINLKGLGVEQLVISGNQRTRIFRIEENATVYVEDMHLTEGRLFFSFDNPQDSLKGGGILNKGTLTLKDMHLSNHTFYSENLDIPTFGGGIFNSGILNIVSSQLDENSLGNGRAGEGAGIFNATSGTVNIDFSLLDENFATNAYPSPGGGIFNRGIANISHTTISNGRGSARGMGICHEEGELFISNSLIHGNFANANYDFGASLGVGIYNASKAELTNVTITNNNSLGSDHGTKGAGLFNTEEGDITLLFCTITGNEGSGLGVYGVGLVNEGTMRIGHTIIAENTRSYPYPYLSDALNEGELISMGFNFVSVNDDLVTEGIDFIIDRAEGDSLGTNEFPIDALLEPLADNGGPTLTRAISACSPLIDAGSTSIIVDKDQRGYHRFAGSANDPGAFEWGASPKVVPTHEVTSEIDGTEGSLRKIIDESTIGAEITFAESLWDKTLYLNPELGEIILNKDITIAGPETNRVRIEMQAQGLQRARIFYIPECVTANIFNLDLSGGLGPLEGPSTDLTSKAGGILNKGSLALNKVELAASEAKRGGGIYNDSTAELNISQSLFYDNEGEYGGAVYNLGKIRASNSTFSTNRVRGKGGNGAGIFNHQSGELFLNHCTIAKDSAIVFGGSRGAGLFNEGIVHMKNTIIAYNISQFSAEGYTPSDGFNNIMGTFDDQGYNLVGDTAGLTLDPEKGNLFNVDPLLVELDYNGSQTVPMPPTRTHALLENSPAIDAGMNDTTIFEDQRGFIRLRENTVDIGAFEYLSYPVAITETLGIDISIRLYPNPVREQLTIEIEAPEQRTFQYYLVNQWGSMLGNQYITSIQTYIDMSRYASGVYFLLIYDSKGKRVSHRILKW